MAMTRCVRCDESLADAQAQREHRCPILCRRCGRSATPGVLAGHCTLCAPSREELASRQWEVDRRHRVATRDAAEGLTPTVDEGPVRHDVAWRQVSGKVLPHLFSTSTVATRSLCGTAFDRGRSHTPKPGMRGCRRCALAAGWIAGLGEAVST
jgi:hypothetical protein